jgi:hypothetical protein
VLEDGVEVWDDAGRPSRRVRLAAADPEGLRRRTVLAALAERAREQLVLRGEVEVGTRASAWPLRSSRRDHDPLVGDRILPELPRLLLLQLEPPLFFSRKGLNRSIGAGKTIVVVGELLMSRSVCR